MSTVPAALNALRDVWAAALAGVRVIDGPWLDSPSEPAVIVVGWLPEEGPTVDFGDAVAGLDSAREIYDVTNLASAWRGDAAMAPTRQAADDLLEGARGAIAADPTLGGVVTRARLAAGSWSQYRTAQGTQVTVEFTVHIDAFRR